jgi:hypothetical protein
MTGLETGTLKKTCRSLFRAPQCLYLHDPQWVENGPAVFFQNSVGSQSLRGALAGVLLLLVLTSCGQKHVDAPPRTPEESLRSIQINPDFKIELVASEPLVYDPVEMVFDENGRLFVAEMLDYPDDPPPGEAARSPHRFRRKSSRSQWSHALERRLNRNFCPGYPIHERHHRRRRRRSA